MDGFSPVKRSPSKKSSKEELPEGHLPRPRGRGPVGKVWDSSIGEWVDKPQDKTIDASLKGKRFRSSKRLLLKGVFHKKLLMEQKMRTIESLL